VLLSISGYTKAVLEAAGHNKWPEILLLDRAHFEAMLCGLTAPADLLTAVLDYASYHGGSYTGLTDLLIARQPASPPAFTTVPPAVLPWPVVSDTTAGVIAQVPLVAADGWPEISGLARGKNHTLLLTVPDGVVEADSNIGATAWVLPLPGCRGTPAVRSDGSVMAVCGYAVVSWNNGILNIVGGGFTGNTNLLRGPGDSTWAFDNSELLTLTCLGAHPGDEDLREIDFPAEVWNASWLGGRRFFLAASGHSAAVDLDVSSTVNRDAWIETPHPWPHGVLTVDRDTVITASRYGFGGAGVQGTVYRMHLASRTSDLIADLAVNSTGNLVATGDGRVFLLADVRGNNRAPHPILVQLTGLLDC
jgi:hypothetical protein